MRIIDVTLTVQDLAAAARFYSETLGLPVRQDHREAVVRIGSSQLTLILGSAFDGTHHLAFGIPPADFSLARQWLAGVVEPIIVGDTEVVDGPEGWDSQSVYFLGPENIVLELIARQSDSDLPGSPGSQPQFTSISEVGISTPDVPATVQHVVEELRCAPFFAQGPTFAPVGDHQGLLIVVEQGRTWFPTQNIRAAQGPLTVLTDAVLAAGHNRGSAPNHLVTSEPAAPPRTSIAAVAER